MRIIVIILLLIVLGFLAWQGAQRFGLIETPAPDSETAVAPDAADGDELAAPAAPVEAALPNFDIVRVDRTGYAVIAGRAAPNADVVIFANGDPLAETKAERDGSWVVSTDTPLDAGPVELGLSMTTPDGLTVRSEQTVIILVPAADGEAPRVLRTTPGGATEVLQEPDDVGEGLGPLALEVIDYDDSGAVIFSGRATPGAIVQILLNRQLIGQTQANDDGRWVLQPDASITPGVYQLLVVQLDENGRPAYAIELPFERADPDNVDLRDGRVIVQPGNSLWRIARRAYGRGAQYTIIYQANADQIRDPDLIYPGQIFDVPDGSEPGGDDESGQ